MAKSIVRVMGEELRERRLERGLSQEELADKAGMSRNFIGLIERGDRNPTLLTLYSLAIALKSSLTELVTAAEKRLK